MSRKIQFILIITILNFIDLRAQILSVSEVDVTNFPRVQVSMMAFKPGGDTYSDLTVNDFDVWENGVKIPKNQLEVWCNISPMKVILVLDKSTSMQEMMDTMRRWDWVVEGAMNFINNMQYTNGSEVALFTFGSNSRLLCEFTNDKKRLYDSLKTITPYGKTNYNAAFMGPYDSPIEMLAKQPSNFRRIIVFLTDGLHDDDEAGSVQTNTISQLLINNNIQCYAITFSADPSPDLNSIASASGGAYFQVVKQKQLNDLYLNIANEIKDRNLCFLSWPTSMVCDEIERYKTVKIEYLRHSATINKVYQVPEQGVSRILSNEFTYKFGNPKLGEYRDLFVEIFSENSPASINNIQINPPTYFQVVDYGFGENVPPTYPISLQKGQRYKLKVRFTPQGIVAFRKANLIITSDPCNAFFPLIGGIPELDVTNPKQGEIFSQCDSIEIKWSGVEPNTPTDLSYSLNDAKTWTMFAKSKTGNSYKWRPGFAHENIRVKAEVSPSQTYVWAISGGGKGNDLANGIAISQNKDAIYVCGYLSGNSVLSDRFIGNLGNTDAFIAKFDLDGNLLWIVNDGSPDNDSAFAVMVDDQDNIYYVGTTYSQPIFGKKITPITTIMLAQHAFIAKYSSNGAIITANALGANSTYPYFRAWARWVRQVGNNIELVGYYTGELKIGSFTLTNTTNPRTFTARYDKNLQLIGLSVGGTISSQTSVKDKDNFTYQVHNFTYYRDFDRFTVKSEGSTDFAVTKFGLSSEGFDISEPFTIAKPSLILTDYNIQLTPNCYLGDTCAYNYPNLVKNNGLVPATITGFEFTGISPFPDYFSVDSSIIGKTLLPNETADLVIKLNPFTATSMEATMRLFGDCQEEIVSKVQASPICYTEVIDTIDFGRVFIGTTKTLSIDNLVVNFNNINLPIKPTLQGKNANEFALIKIQSDTIIKKSQYKINIQFKPQYYGERTARINLNMETPCGPQVIQIVGFGVYPSATLPDEINWGIRRINKNYDSTIIIENPTTSLLKLKEIKWGNPPTNSEFSYLPFAQYPIDIPPQSKIDLPVSFLPKQEIPYESQLIFVVQNQDEINEIPVKLIGQGHFPDLTMSWDCGQPVKPNETTEAKLILANNSNNSPLKIDRVSLVSNNGVFKWKNGTPTDGLIVNPKQVLELFVEYTPKDYSNNLVRITAWADNYDGQFSDFWKENTNNFYCQAIGMEYPKKLNLGTNIVCENTTYNFTIKNTNQSSDLILFLSRATINGADKDAFELLTNIDYTLKGANEYICQIKFVGSIPKNLYQATLLIPTSIGEDISIELEAKAIGVNITSSKKDIKEIPGSTAEFSLILKSESANQSIESLDFTIYYPSNQVQIDDKSFISKITNNWIWTKIDFSKLGEIHFVGNGIIPTPTNQELGSLKLMFLLDTGKTSMITSQIKYPCNYVSNEDLLEVFTIPVCFDNGRSIYIRLEGNAPLLEPILPNPAKDIIELNFSCANKMKVEGAIFDIFGQKVREIINKEYNTGVYKEIVTLDDIQPGVYFIKFGNSEGSQLYKFIINK